LAARGSRHFRVVAEDFDDDQGHVIALVAAGAEGVEVLADGGGDLFGGVGGAGANEVAEAVFAVEVAGGVDRIPDAVRAEDDDVAGAQWAEGLLGELDGGIDAQGDAVVADLVEPVGPRGARRGGASAGRPWPWRSRRGGGRGRGGRRSCG
jgi:hypothetical protein